MGISKIYGKEKGRERKRSNSKHRYKICNGFTSEVNKLNKIENTLEFTIDF
jgi:hypothetical protein